MPHFLPANPKYQNTFFSEKVFHIVSVDVTPQSFHFHPEQIELDMKWPAKL